MYEFIKLKATIEGACGFVCYEDMPGLMHIWYGTSDQFETFKTKVAGWLKTGDVVMFVDTGATKTYSAFKQTWY